MNTLILRWAHSATMVLAVTFAASGIEVASPDGRTALNFEVRDAAGAVACPVYRVSFNGRPIITDSRLDLEFTNGWLMEGLELTRVIPNKRDAEWKPFYG